MIINSIVAKSSVVLISAMIAATNGYGMVSGECVHGRPAAAGSFLVSLAWRLQTASSGRDPIKSSKVPLSAKITS